MSDTKGGCGKGATDGVDRDSFIKDPTSVECAGLIEKGTI
jgi:hypothetical protein